jgi:hypothetical protein
LAGDERSMGSGPWPCSAPLAVWRPQNIFPNQPFKSSFSPLAQTFTELAQREAGRGAYGKRMSITGSSSGDA